MWLNVTDAISETDVVFVVCVSLLLNKSPFFVIYPYHIFVYKRRLFLYSIFMPRRDNSKALYWILTIPQHVFTPYLPPGVEYIRGQLESGGSTGYLHWQLVAVLSSQSRLSFIKKIFGDCCHAEPTKSRASEDYVWKDDTCVQGTRFELGARKFNRSDSKDWAAILESAKTGDLSQIPPDVVIRSYHNLKRIGVDHLRPSSREVFVSVFVGPTGTGKSHTAWLEAGLGAYPKDPLSKFWDGYSGQENVVIDEFRGTVSISHLLRWLDRYPVIVEVKGGSTVLRARRFWITSNLQPRFWYPELDTLTRDALLRRLSIVEMKTVYVPDPVSDDD